jgi:hypothetical protein
MLPTIPSLPISAEAAHTGLFKWSHLPSWMAWCLGFASIQGWTRAWSTQLLI